MNNSLSWIAPVLLFLAFEVRSQSPAPSETKQITVNFDDVDASQGRRVANDYLKSYGITISGVTNSTIVAILHAADSYKGRALIASSSPNVLTQVNSNDPVSFTLSLPAEFGSVRFTRPALTAGETGITFPAWQAQALDSAGHVLDEVGEPLGSGEKYYSDVPAQTFTLNGRRIKAVRFNSQNNHFAAFSAVVIDA